MTCAKYDGVSTAIEASLASKGLGRRRIVTVPCTGFGPGKACEDIFVAPMKSWLVARTGWWGLAFTAYRMWRRVPPRHRRRIIAGARKHGPRVARKAATRAKRLL